MERATLAAKLATTKLIMLWTSGRLVATLATIDGTSFSNNAASFSRGVGGMLANEGRVVMRLYNSEAAARGSSAAMIALTTATPSRPFLVPCD